MNHIDDKKIKKLQEVAKQVRIDIVQTLAEAGSGHLSGSLGMVEVFVSLYFEALNQKPKQPNWAARDRLILSNGHICPALYATLAQAGYFSKSKLKTLRQFGSKLQGHPERKSLPGLETTSGPLGDGFGQAAGIAYAAKMDKKKFHTYCLMSDGEQQCGIIWETAMFAAQYNLDNLTAIIDRNNIQISGTTKQVMSLEPLVDKYESFGWHVLEIDGHNIEQIIYSINLSKEIKQPCLIIANTIPGKGIPEIENDYTWHGKAPDKKQAAKFIKQIQNYAF